MKLWFLKCIGECTPWKLEKQSSASLLNATNVSQTPDKRHYGFILNFRTLRLIQQLIGHITRSWLAVPFETPHTVGAARGRKATRTCQWASEKWLSFGCVLRANECSFTPKHPSVALRQTSKKQREIMIENTAESGSHCQKSVYINECRLSRCDQCALVVTAHTFSSGKSPGIASKTQP